MPVRAPTGVHVPNDVNKALLLTGAIRIVIDAEDVSELIEGQLLHVAKSPREDFEIRTIRLAAENRTLVGIFKMEPFLGSYTQALVSDRPIDTTVDPDSEAVHVVTSISEVRSETVGDGLTLIRFPVAIRIS
ncbi:hypothetical protein N9Q98_01140, partial [bacterium]|nr:hypothetical protein [bacterium]